MVQPMSQSKRNCAVFKAGVVNYQQGLDLQEEARKLVVSEVWDGVLILLEHSPVITIGRSGGGENLLVPQEWLTHHGVEVVYSNRGGNITCHNPGQIVGYPVFNLASWHKDAHWYLRSLEEVLIATLSRFNLEGKRKEKYTGVWLGDKKVAAIGVAIKQWITSHGFALNVLNNLSLFDTIIPCGIQNFGVTSLIKSCNGLDTDRNVFLAQVMDLLRGEFEAIYDCSLVNLNKLGGFYARMSSLAETEINSKYGNCSGTYE